MSADNWTDCPKCGPESEAWDQKLAAAYGKVSAAEYARLVNAREEEPGETLREDYQVGIRKGRFRVDYCASCTNCGFRFAYKHSAPAEGKP